MSSGKWRPSRLGLNVLNQFPPFHYFPDFLPLSKHWSPIEYRIYIWQVSLQFRCMTLVKYECQQKNLTGDFTRLKISQTGKLDHRDLVTPTLELYLSYLY